MFCDIDWQWREQLKSALKAMNAGDAAEAAVRQTDRILRNAEKERAFREARLPKVNTLCVHLIDAYAISCIL